MSHIKNVTGTAFVVAQLRAEENQEPAPLYQDPVVGLFLDDDSRTAAGQFVAAFPPAAELVRIRTKYLDDTLDKHLASEFTQVLILGAGLDTRAVRKRTANVTYFEIDDAETLALKQRRYAEQGLAADVVFIPGNYVTDGLVALLKRSRFDFDAPTYVIWEGNTMYLPIDRVKATLETLKRHLRRFAVSFDYMSDAVIADATGDSGIVRFVHKFAAMGAPWHSGIRDVQALACELGLSLLENFRTADLHRTYWRSRRITSPIFDFYSVCTLAG